MSFNQLVCCTKAKTKGLCTFLVQPPLCLEFLVTRGALLTNVVEYVLLSLCILVIVLQQAEMSCIFAR